MDYALLMSNCIVAKQDFFWGFLCWNGWKELWVPSYIQASLYSLEDLVSTSHLAYLASHKLFLIPNWKGREQYTHSHYIKKGVGFYIIVANNTNKPPRTQTQVKWNKPLSGWVKLNIDIYKNKKVMKSSKLVGEAVEVVSFVISLGIET